MFAEILPESFDEREKRILEFWSVNKIFTQSVEENRDKPLFAFYDGPPFATGLPHYGHLLAGTIKDVVLRYKTMKGFCVPRRFGWDCHGLPVENEIEKMHNLSGGEAIQTFGIANFNEECRKIVLRYTEEWKTIVQRMGRWVDFDQTYRTMDVNFMESVWWVFQQLYNKGLVYEGYKVMPYSAKLGTPLSNFEAGENYKEVDDPALTIAFPLLDEPHIAILAWTTTPWTLVSNLALMVGPEIDYVKILHTTSGQHYILAKSRLSATFKSESEYQILEEMKGRNLAGKSYKPPFKYFADRASKGAFRVILEDSVSVEEGTGIVHAAPAFGEVDFYACQREGIEIVCPVDSNGLFTSEIPEYQGLFVKDSDKEIIKHLKKEGIVFSHGVCRHRYPFCWRSDTPLIYKAVTTWFVAVEKIKDSLVKANEQIHWTPSYVKHGRFGKWLEGARDWAISRNRYWGTPIPIWRAEDGEILVLGSIQELESKSGAKIKDLHRHFIDQLTFTHNGKVFKRIPEVFDCWFESGSMPYAQNHYPFENQALFKEIFPADFIAEGLDQTRGWFYTLTILSTALFDQPAFKNVIVNGIVLAEDGAKMSKRLRNYPDPSLVIERFGADAIRVYMMHSPAVRAEDLCFVEAGVELILRQVMLPLWNAYSFFITYARIYGWRPCDQPKKPMAIIDRWVISLLNKLIKQVEVGMDDYNLSHGIEPTIYFIEQLTNWYIRRSRRRFWEEKESIDRNEAFATLYHVLLTFTKVAAPYIPFMSEAVYQNLKSEEMPQSVHLCAYPEYNEQMRDEQLEAAMAAVQSTVSLGHALRKEHKLKVRQPLAKAHIISADSVTLQFLKEQQHLIADELNVKIIEFAEKESLFVSLKAKPNFRVLGKKVGKLMKATQQAIDAFNQEQLSILLKGHSLPLFIEDTEVVLTSEDVQVERQVFEGLAGANEGSITIVLETVLNEDLLMEGIARELVNKINTMRREANLEVTDRIYVNIETTERVRLAFEHYKEYVQQEVLAVTVEFNKSAEGDEWDINNEPARIWVNKANSV
ncbi:isoleucine--tRNA ligase [Neochlamydia sp. S13]|uniref:isoleucine--tRNA ligase n=1 Tax=Neochlamydia sp. S13 TaxID=1353976 RepID=UPI0005A7D09E|nr:isoleucine--tRNA ligase [Neochlamydia sp. S13]BBI17534.1 isoleucyl-tRNA synthetase [Neochlamydia sp. S13]